jgi:riboflavin kinase/FMN adenylyltransferase
MNPKVLAIGNFDGVHAGHRALLERVVRHAAVRNLEAAALTFDPHPAAIVAPERVPEMLCTLDERIGLLRKAGAQEVIVLPFTRELSQMTPREFVEGYVLRALNARAIFVGENFRFGHRQAGDAATLVELGAGLGFETGILAPVVMRGEIVSSSSIRRQIRCGRVSLGGRLLGRCYALKGPVAGGQGIGSKQTVPTLNLRPTPGLVLPRGVFITETIDLESTSRRWPSITNVGKRPTFQGEDVTIETFLLAALVGDTPGSIEVRFRRFVRDEQKFDSAEALKLQILRDVARAQAYWRRVGNRYTET